MALSTPVNRPVQPAMDPLWQAIRDEVDQEAATEDGAEVA